VPEPAKDQAGHFVTVPSVRADAQTIYGVRSHFADVGEGDVVVLVHGGGVTEKGYRGWSPIFEPLSRLFRVVAPDMLWSGLTDKPAVAYSFRAQVDHLAGLLDTLAIDRVHIIGQSIGAYLAARFACDYPQRVNRLVIVGSNTVSMMMGLDVGAEEWTEDTLRNEMRNPAEARQLLETIRHDAATITDEEVASYVNPHRPADLRQARETYISYVQALVRKDPGLWQEVNLRHRLPILGRPTCVIWGRDDRYAPVTLGRQLRPLLPDAEYHEIEDASHHVFHDQTEGFCNLVTDFLLRERRD
jgi:2-hydroxy-6-oxonona-2,4-dienedioate hydrolase